MGVVRLVGNFRGFRGQRSLTEAISVWYGSRVRQQACNSGDNTSLAFLVTGAAGRNQNKPAFHVRGTTAKGYQTKKKVKSYKNP